MKFLLDRSAEGYEEGLRILLNERGHELIGSDDGQGPETWTVISKEKGVDGELTVSLKEGRLWIGCVEKAHFFRGFMKALRRMEAPESNTQEAEFRLREKICFRSVDAMLDCSRNGVLKAEKIMEYLRRMASLGMNCLMLYTEETYEIPGYPYFGAFRGRYTKEEWKLCDDYADLFGIELVPCIQTLAHLHTALRWKEMEVLTDTPDILMAGDERVYSLIDAMIGTMSASVRSRRIHLGMDEAHELGLGKYLNKNGYQNRFEIMNRHLNRVLAICKKYGMEPMIWSDMYFRLKSPTGGYYDLPPETDFSGLAELPEGAALVYWDYYHDDKEHYKNYIKLHKKLADQVIFAGGAWIWNGIAPNYSKMSATLTPALEACREGGVKEAVCTFWQDNGAETPMEAGSLSLVTFAESCFLEEDGCEGGIKSRISDSVRFLWGDDEKAWWLLDRFDRTPGTGRNNENADNPSKFLLYQDVMLGLFDGQIRGLGLAEHYRKLEKELAEYRLRHPDSNGIFEYYEVLARLLAMKSELGIRIYDSYHDGNTEFLKEAGEVILPSCVDLVKRISFLRKKLWLEECKIFGYEVLDIRFAGIAARLESAQSRIMQYVSGEIGSLPELEEERLVYAPDESGFGHALCSCNLWQNMISAGNIAGV